MAKVKKVSINAFEKAIRENIAPNISTEEWCGLEITITNTIPLKDMMSLVAEGAGEIADVGYLQIYLIKHSGLFYPGCDIDRYTNINLPGSLEARYDLVMRSGILDFILPKINSNQYNDIVVAVRDRIDYMCDTNVTEFRNSLTEMVTSMSMLQEKTAELFGNINPEEVHSLLNAFGDSKAVEERVVDTYIEKQKAELKIVGEE